MAQKILSFARIFKNLSTRLLFEVLLFVITIAVGFIIYTYNTQIEGYKNVEFKKLDSIAKTLCYQINGDLHENLLNEFPNKDDINSISQSQDYLKIHKLLQGAMIANDLGTDIYTLALSDEGRYEFGVSSAENTYYKHVWANPIKEIINTYDVGAKIGPYESPNGTWLSAFEPIKNSAGKTVAVVQVDQEFGSFIANVKSKVMRDVGVVAIILVLLIAYMVIHVRKIFFKEDEVRKEILSINEELEEKSRDLTDSINSAKKIQMAMLSDMEEIKKSFPEMFIMFQPRDIVSGDFFWFAKKENRSYFAVADCTGHGVPGAFMSMVGNTILNEIINTIENVNPAQVLQELNKKVSNTLYRQDGTGTRDGMDIGLCCFDHEKNTLEYSGALRPLICISGDELIKIPADRFAIGGNKRDDKIFTNKLINVKEGDTLYMYSDGYHDQFGGERGKKYQSKRFRELLREVNDLHIEDQKYLLQYEFHLWKEHEEQIDDVLVAGFKIPPRKSA